MIKWVKYHHTMSGIKSVEDALAFKKEALVISLEELTRSMDDSFLDSLVKKDYNTAFYIADEIYPVYIIGSSDKFYTKIDNQLTPIEVVPGLDLSNVYMESNQVNSVTDTKGPKRLTKMFGPAVHLNRSKAAIARIAGIHALFLYLQREGLHCIELLGLPIPQLKEVFPKADVEAWREREIALRPTDPEQLKLLPPINEREFWDDLIGYLYNQIPLTIMDIHDFYEFDQDNFYVLRVERDRIVLEKGIDHKYLPYYEQKFASTEDHS